MTAIRSETLSASTWSWVTSRTVMPSRRSSRLSTARMASGTPASAASNEASGRSALDSSASTSRLAV